MRIELRQIGVRDEAHMFTLNRPLKQVLLRNIINAAFSILLLIVHDVLYSIHLLVETDVGCGLVVHLEDDRKIGRASCRERV